jgi:hypothetical protein
MNGTTVFINADGSPSCQDRAPSVFEACTVTITDPATGNFTYSEGTSSGSGTFAFLAGTASASHQAPSAAPMEGNFVAGRR